MKKQFITYLLICSLVSAYSFLPMFAKNVSAASFSKVSATLSTSEPSVSATTTLVFTTTQTIDNGGKIDITFPAGFTMTVNNGDIDCGTASLTPSISGQVVTCTNSSGADYTVATTTVTVGQNTNPTVGSYTIDIESKNSGGTVLETGQAMVAIVDTVQVSATVEATLQFAIAPVATSTAINGGSETTGSSTATSLAFGTLDSTGSSTMAQKLTVITNASEGYTVTVQQNQNLTNAGGDDIDSFVDGTPGSAQAWVSPAGTLDNEATYGHFGVTSDDDSLTAGDEFGLAKYKGFNGTAAMEVMYHDGPADGSTVSKGLANVAYKIEITALQEAGDYTNTLTYICTPTY